MKQYVFLEVRNYDARTVNDYARRGWALESVTMGNSSGSFVVVCLSRDHEYDD